MSEKPTQTEIDWNTASWSDFQKRRQELRENFRAPVPYFSGGNYQEATSKKSALISAGFEAELSTALDGVSIHIDDEDKETYEKLQKYASENGLKILMTRP